MLLILLACGDKTDDTSGPLESGTPLTDSGGCTPDADGDGYCADDCDDDDAGAYPGAPESCNDIDDDCDGEIDEDAGPTWYLDEDGDGYGGEAVVACEAPDSYADNGADCDDSDASSYPGAEEVADGADNDCDGDTDEGVVVDDEFDVQVSWSSSGVTVSITGGSGSYELGMAETGAGSLGWFGESCIPGDEPWGYEDYGYEVCHSLGSTGGTIPSVDFDDVGTNQTIFQSIHHPDITYFVGAMGSADCWVFGDAPSYYADFGCQTL